MKEKIKKKVKTYKRKIVRKYDVKSAIEKMRLVSKFKSLSKR